VDPLAANSGGSCTGWRRARDLFVSTSYLDEAEFCSRNGLLNKGHLLTTVPLPRSSS
jgi:hypothetical protein